MQETTKLCKVLKGWTVEGLDKIGGGFGFHVLNENGVEVMRSLSRYECDRTALAHNTTLTSLKEILDAGDY